MLRQHVWAQSAHQTMTKGTSFPTFSFTIYVVLSRRATYTMHARHLHELSHFSDGTSSDFVARERCGAAQPLPLAFFLQARTRLKVH